jgi:hypothetical protein
MALVNIINYQAAWDLNDHHGEIRFQSANGNWSPVKILNDPNEFRAVVDLLRNERPVFHNTDYDRIQTRREGTGEGE